MTNREFCYWLQGYFEISVQAKKAIELDTEQVVAIKNHLNLVRKVDKKLDEFPSWLEGYLESCNGGLNEEAVNKIRTKLNFVFKHDIDPSYPGKQVDLNKIHNGGGFNPNQVMRC